MHTHLLLVVALTATSLGAQDVAEPDPRFAIPLGGPATVTVVGADAFSYPSPSLTRTERRAFMVGNSFFKQNWVQAPASAAERDGLGPLFNARSCSGCHFKDGRGRPAENGEDLPGLLLRLGMPGDGADVPHPVYGGQLQDRAVLGARPEARFVVREDVVEGTFADGTPYELVRPRYELTDWSGPEPSDTLRIGPRVANQVVGLGLLEAIPVARLEELADPDDADGDGISGRIHWLPGEAGESVAGRFGWKATQPTVKHQSAAAFAGDLGITSPLFPSDDQTDVQRSRIDLPNGGTPEIDDQKLDRVAFYSATLAVPAQRDADLPEVLRGAELFDRFGCARCHTPVQHTGDAAITPSFRDVSFRPYTDLLLHDLGEDLADPKRDGDAEPAEWRTPPLWGIGLFEAVNGHTRYLHDGRARNLAEAVLWHGGEAAAARAAFVACSAAERGDLLHFLESL